MTDAPRLTLEYLEFAPAAAAEVLQTIKAEDAAAYLESVPGRLAAPVLVHMAPWTAARCMTALSVERAAAVCRRLAFNEAVSLLRLMPADPRERIFAEMPDRQARRLRSALRYPLGQVGAWADPDVPVLWQTATVDDALRLLRQSPTVSHLFVESEAEGRFSGAVAVRVLLTSAGSMRLAELPAERVTPLSNRAALHSVVFDARWDEFLHLPVVGRSGAVLGGLSRRALREGIREQREGAERHRISVPEQLLAALGATCAGVFHMLTDRPGAGSEHRKGVVDGPQ